MHGINFNNMMRTAQSSGKTKEMGVLYYNYAGYMTLL